MSYSKLEWTYKAQKPDGSLDAGLDFKYDLKQNKQSLILRDDGQAAISGRPTQ